jgi:hypothetical protein
MKLPTSLQVAGCWCCCWALALTWLLATVWTWYDARHELDELLDGHLAQAAALLVVQQVRTATRTTTTTTAWTRRCCTATHRAWPSRCGMKGA